MGKTTVAHRMLELDGRYEFVRSVTTRPCRADQFDNEYIYISADEFRNLIETGGVLEHTEYAGNMYGTPRSEIDRITADGRIPLLILDINGVISLSNNRGDISPCGVYVYDDISVMKARLAERYASELHLEETQRRLNSRLRQNLIDYSKMPEYQSYFYAFVRNCESVDECADKISRAFAAFVSGAEKNAEGNARLAQSLCDSVAVK